MNLTDNEITEFAEDVLNMSLSGTNGESAISNSFHAESNLKKGYLDVVFHYPVSFIVDAKLNDEILRALTSAFYPYLTFFPANGPYFVATGSDDITQARALRFYFKVGIYQRLKYDKISDVHAYKKDGDILFPLMNGYFYNMTKNSGHIAITGASGNGKTAFSLVLLQMFRSIGADITVVDEKLDFDLYQFCKAARIEHLSPAEDQNDNGFLNSVIKALKSAVDEIHKRQRALISNNNAEFKPKVIFIDEAMALTAGAQKKVIDEYMGLINRITLMGRSAKVYLVISSQTLEAKSTISSSARDQIGLKILLSNNPTVNDCRYVFKDFDPSSVVITKDGFSKGLGLISQQSDNRIVPFMAPYIGDFTR